MAEKYYINAEQMRILKHTLCNTGDDAYRNYYYILEGAHEQHLIDNLVEQGLMLPLCDPLRGRRPSFRRRLYYSATGQGANLAQVAWVPYGYYFYGLVETPKGLKTVKARHYIYDQHAYPHLKVENGDNPKTRSRPAPRAFR
jgi:hypothetical protein